MNQTQVGLCVCSPFRLGINAELGEGKLSRLPPQLNGSLNLWGPEKVGLLRSLRGFRHHGSGAVHVVAPNLVLCAIATVNM